jgi:hypothetical protein
MENQTDIKPIEPVQSEPEQIQPIAVKEKKPLSDAKKEALKIAQTKLKEKRILKKAEKETQVKKQQEQQTEDYLKGFINKLLDEKLSKPVEKVAPAQAVKQRGRPKKEIQEPKPSPVQPPASKAISQADILYNLLRGKY